MTRETIPTSFPTHAPYVLRLPPGSVRLQKVHGEWLQTTVEVLWDQKAPTLSNTRQKESMRKFTGGQGHVPKSVAFLMNSCTYQEDTQMWPEALATCKNTHKTNTLCMLFGRQVDPMIDPVSLRRLQKASRRLQDGSKTTPRGPKMAPERLQDGPACAHTHARTHARKHAHSNTVARSPKRIRAHSHALARFRKHLHTLAHTQTHSHA